MWEGGRGKGGVHVPYDNDRLCVWEGAGGFYGVDSVFLLSLMFATDHKFLENFSVAFSPIATHFYQYLSYWGGGVPPPHPRSPRL